MRKDAKPDARKAERSLVGFCLIVWSKEEEFKAVRFEGGR
jgi:hypothetical protein